ncbi:MAG: gliding motility protein GldM [Prevotellaceae bacterium]|jgi:gliding motility-associated protein GldM|nr:gliding motility protein GldM [Prevotellaceae bacterium]
MAGGKLTPRQKMINMMYLVLTAMLALNVSAEVMDAFAKIERGLDRTISITNEKNESTLGVFEDAVSELGKKAEEWRDKAALTRQKTLKLIDYIQDLKIELIREGDGKDTHAVTEDKAVHADSIHAMDNTDAANRILLGVENNGKAYNLHDTVITYREFLINKIIEKNPGLKTSIEGLLDFTVPKKGLTDTRDWETFSFSGTPLISAIALLSKMQVDILNCESYVLDFLKSNIGKDDLKISNVEAAVSNPNGMILKGSTGEAEVFLVAFDESIQAEVSVGGRIIPMKGGKAKIPFSGTSIGPSTVAGNISYRNASGETERRPFKFEYNVVEPSLAISPTKMNVFYLGVDNPVDISVSGVAQKDVHVSITNGTMTQVGNSGSYIVKPSAVGKSNISATALVNGEQKTIGTREYRVKRVPDPTPSLLNITGSTVTKGELSAVVGVVAKMPVDFDFELAFTVVSFSLEVITQGYWNAASSSSNRFTEEQKQLLSAAKTGSRILITDIKAKGPDGFVRDLPPLSYKVN